MHAGRLFVVVLVVLSVVPVSLVVGQQPPGATDLDALMERALAKRDQNWKKLDQYILDEQEDADVRGPGDALMLGDHREYTWFVRDGFFVRSPVRANGVAIPEAERLAYEQRWLRQERNRQAARNRRTSPGPSQPATGDTDPNANASGDVAGLVQQTREPRFISAGYFLEFEFEPGNYYLAGRETINGKQLLRVEYYPTNLFADRRNRRVQNRDQDRNPRQQEIQRQMNRTALVTLWVDPAAQEIVKYTFDNLGLDFFPGGWLIRFTDMTATIDMAEPFPDVWLPGTLDIRLSLSLATGSYNVRYNLKYHNYKQASVKATIRPRP